MLRKIHRAATAVLLGATVAPQIACLGGGERERNEGPVVEARENAPVSASNETSDVSVEALSSLEKVYVPLLPESMHSLDDALADKGYGNVMASDFRPRFEHVDTDFGQAVVAYSSGDWVERESLFQPMTVHQWLEAALEDFEAHGVIINPGHPGQTLALTRAEAIDVLGWLPKRDPLPMEIYIAQ